jgi:hypothetical protein
MPRQLTVILLLLSFAAQVFNQNILVLDYYSNRAAFARACENKARPGLHCNGKCQLMKKLKEEEKKDQQNPTRKSENKHEVVCSQPVIASTSFFDVLVLSSFPSHAGPFIPAGSSADIFHPPALV